MTRDKNIEKILKSVLKAETLIFFREFSKNLTNLKLGKSQTHKQKKCNYTPKKPLFPIEVKICLISYGLKTV